MQFGSLSLSLSLSLRFNGHFPGGPGLAGIRMSPFWIIGGDEGAGTTGAIRILFLITKDSDAVRPKTENLEPNSSAGTRSRRAEIP